MSSTTPNLGLFKYNTTADANVAFSITKALNNNWDIIDKKCGQSNNILDFKWSDHLLNDQSWLRADTFSWQNGTTYSLVYNELLAEYNNSASTAKTEGSITFKSTPKGYKIALASQETAVLNKYNSDGIAWYYILDTTNKRFKLPRAKHPSLVTLTSPAPVVGNGMTLGLTNGSTNAGLTPAPNDWYVGATTSQYGVNVGSVTTYTPVLNTIKGLGVTTDPTKSGIVADLSSNVKDYNMYLYFYVGAFTKSAESQTAGLKAELLNGKLDLNANNIDTEGKSLISGLGMPSDKYIDLTLGASGTAYTAPANGWFKCTIDTSANGWLSINDEWHQGSNISGFITILKPIRKGQNAYIEYSRYLNTVQFRFIYAEGEV